MGDDSLATLKAKKLALENKIRQMENRNNAAKRKKENHRKFLVGSAVLSEAEKNQDYKLALYGLLARALTRKEDRATLGLPPLPVTTDKKTGA